MINTGVPLVSAETEGQMDFSEKLLELDIENRNQLKELGYGE